MPRPLRTRQRARELRDLRRWWLSELGWTVVTDMCVYAPDDHARTTMHSLATAARSAGLPGQLEDLEAWKPDAAVVLETPPPTEGANAGTIGEPWRIPHAAESAQRIRAFEVDVGSAERGMRGHVETERALAATLCALGISPLSPKQSDPPFDVGWIHDGRFFVAEVKSITPENEEHQLRLGLGQVLRYTYALSSTEDEVKPVLVPEAEPRDATWFEVCESVGVVLLSGPHIAGQLRRLLDEGPT